jgi:hypothetical protein
LHQLRYFAATHLGDQKVPLQLMMAKTQVPAHRRALRQARRRGHRRGRCASARICRRASPSTRAG